MADDADVKAEEHAVEQRAVVVLLPVGLAVGREQQEDLVVLAISEFLSSGHPCLPNGVGNLHNASTDQTGQ